MQVLSEELASFKPSNAWNFGKNVHPWNVQFLVFSTFSRLLRTNSHSIQYFLLVSQRSYYTETHTGFAFMQRYASH